MALTKDEFLAAVASGETGTFKVEGDDGKIQVITIKAQEAEVLKAYISQPMKGKEPDEIITERELASVHLSELFPDSEIEIIDTYDQEGFDEATCKNPPVWFLGRNIQKLSEADVVYFVDGWKDARGCVIEHAIAESYGIEIAYDGETEATAEDSSVAEAEAVVDEAPVYQAGISVPPLVH